MRPYASQICQGPVESECSSFGNYSITRFIGDAAVVIIKS